MSYKNELKRFFMENPVTDESPTPPALAHFFLLMESSHSDNGDIHDIFSDAPTKFQPGREKAIQSERNEIENASGGEQIIRLMRRNTDPVNQHILVKKAMEFESEIVPELVKMLKTSLNDGFIEAAIRVLVKSTANVAEDLIGGFGEMRGVYAQSMVLVLLGFIADEKYIPWFIERYYDLKKRYPNESYCDGAYYALYQIESRLYPK